MLAERDIFISYFTDLDAPRTNVHNQLHLLEDLLLLTILAVLCGADKAFFLVSTRSLGH
jgi:hypothetical protein